MITLGLLIYFFFDDLIKTSLYDFVLVESKEVYKLKFQEVDFQFKNSTLTIKGVHLQPDTNRYKSLVKDGGKQKPLYTVRIEEIQLQKFNFLELYYDGRLEIDKILVIDPVVDQIGIHHEDVSKPHKKFIEVLQNVSNKYLEETQINEIVLRNGNFGFYSAIGDTLTDAGIDGISIYLKEFRINDATVVSDKKILFSEDIEINLEKIEAILINNSHWLTIDSISFSTIDSSLNTHGVKVEPVDSLKRGRGVEDKLLINFDMPSISFADVNINKLFFEDYLASDSLIFKKPVLKLYGQPKKGSDNRIDQQFNKRFLLDLFSDYLVGIDVNHLFLEHGNYVAYDGITDTVPRTHAESIDFSLNGIHIDTAHLDDQQELIIADDASLIVERFVSRLQKTRHRLTIEKIHFDSYSEFIALSQLSLVPDGNVSDSITAGLPFLRISQVNFRKLLNSGEVIAEKVYVKKPDITANMLLDASKQNKTADNNKPFKMIAFDSLYLDSCRYTIKLRDSMGVVQSELHCRLLLLELLNDTIDFSHTELFEMGAIDLIQEDFHFSIPSINRKIEVGQMHISSVDSTVYLKNASMLTVDDSQELADANGIPGRIDIPELILSRIDPVEYFRDKNLLAQNLVVTNPYLELAVTNKFSGNEHLTKKLLRKKMSEVFAVFSINKVQLKNLKIGLSGNDQPPLIQHIGDHGLTIGIDGFAFNKHLPDPDRFLFSEDITLNINDLTVPFQGTFYSMSIKDLYLSTMGRNVKLTGLRLNTSENESLSLNLPRFEINRIDFEKLLFGRQIEVGSIELLAPDLFLKPHFNKQPDGEMDFVVQNPGIIKTTSIDSVLINYGELYYENQDGMIDSLKTDFKVLVRDVNLEEGVSYRFGKDSLITDKIELTVKNLFSRGMRGFYTFSLADGNIRIDSGKMALHGLKLHPAYPQLLTDDMREDTMNHVISVEIPHATIDGIGFEDLIRLNGLHIGDIGFKKTNVGLFSLKIPVGDENPKEQTKLRLPKSLPELSIGNVDFGDVNFKWHQVFPDSVTSFILDDLLLKVNRLQLDSASINGPHNFMFAENIELESDHYGFNTKNGMYEMYFGKLKLSTGANKVTLDSFSLRPRFEKYEFARRVGHQTDRMILSVEDISINKLDFKALTQSSSIISERIDIGSFQFEAFRDKSVPFPEDQLRGMPRQMLKQIPLKTIIDTIALNNGKITYGERMHKTWSDGEVILDDFNGTITGLKNDWSKDDTLVAKVDFKLMKEGDAHIKLGVPLASKADTFFLHGELNRMDLSAFNSMTRSLFGVAIKKGMGEVDDIRMHGNAENMTGELIFPFRKLKIQLINPRTGERGGIGDGIMTFLANEILLRSNNPRFLRKIRVGTVYAPRDPKRSIFNYIWKGILSGIESTLGYSDKEQRQQRRELRKKQRKE
ncbi:MAG: hypothetical protein K9G67_02600 [Bacteroidales bacterium]|nr:hypothetical protein [Bacteroidales bacterium]MCF8344126.1 hypothetical protein [Bacteroidales bacterium]MCF8350526.1 hypothetical protein [Bacteroidales bacterium]MCF8375217.1 hypothetical protein [Bacteroidales bacterium]MCF8400241.1 hypothetical protein [Bacteroidales bacterium]